jgi:hypothetical protein
MDKYSRLDVPTWEGKARMPRRLKAVNTQRVVPTVRRHRLKHGTHQANQALNTGTGAAQALACQRGQEPRRATSQLC